MNLELLTDAEIVQAIYGKSPEHRLNPKSAGVVLSAAMVLEKARSSHLARVVQGTEELTDGERVDLLYRLSLQKNNDSAKSLGIDVTAPPYEVPCPVCLAFALGPCMSERREPVDTYPYLKFPASARVLLEQHPERWEHWKKHPDWRVKVVR